MEDWAVLRWIPFLPLLAAALNVFCGQLWGRRRTAGLLACGAVGMAFILSFWTFLRLSPEGHFSDTLWTWIGSDPFEAAVSFRVDALSAVMLLVITGVGLLIHVYSLGYMGQDADMVRYFAYLNLFVFFMLLLVMADNLLLLFVGWEGVGLCSYLLIGFWHHEDVNAIAANKAFIVNRIGDLGFLLGLLLLIWEAGQVGIWTLEFSDLKRAAPLLTPEKANLIALLLFIGATGKSAQIPLYVWLPDAMQGPTPVSALIHAATMVTAGVYMTARLHFLFALAPVVLASIAVIGVMTAFLAATVALAQNDIKRVLAYSTVSQLGYMFVAVGVEAFSAAIFHLFTHAFFKACLFLSAGSVIHGLQGEQDMRKMGGLRPYFRITYWTHLVAALAISGAPLTAGFFSKDLILWHALASPGGSLGLWLFSWLTAGLTAFYMFRQFFMVFHGECRVAAHVKPHIHESPLVMTVPLMLLALGSIFSGWLGAPELLWGSAWDRWLQPVVGSPHGRHAGLFMELTLMTVTLVVAAGGFLLAYRLYCAGPRPVPAAAERGLRRWLANKYYVDELYDRALVRPFTGLAGWLAEFFDPRVIDGVVNGVAERVGANSAFWRRLQSGNAQHYLFGFLAGTLVILGLYLYG